jgi:hypothetical protein
MEGRSIESAATFGVHGSINQILRRTLMDRIKKREFVGSQLLLWIMSISIIGLPLAVVYLINGTIETEFEVEDADQFWENYKKK